MALSHKSFARSMQKKRKSSIGDHKLPKAWKDLDDTPEQFTKTSSGEQFLIFNKEVDNTTGARILGFSSPSLLDVLRNASDISIDGTFDITKWTLFSQVKIAILVNLFYIFRPFFGLTFSSLISKVK